MWSTKPLAMCLWGTHWLPPERLLWITLQVVRTSFRFHLREFMWYLTWNKGKNQTSLKLFLNQNIHIRIYRFLEIFYLGECSLKVTHPAGECCRYFSPCFHHNVSMHKAQDLLNNWFSTSSRSYYHSTWETEVQEHCLEQSCNVTVTKWLLISGPFLTNSIPKVNMCAYYLNTHLYSIHLFNDDL